MKPPASFQPKPPLLIFISATILLTQSNMKFSPVILVMAIARLASAAGSKWSAVSDDVSLPPKRAVLSNDA
jgi:hypothetical protein